MKLFTRIKKWSVNLSLVLFSILFALGAGELIFRFCQYAAYQFNQHKKQIHSLYKIVPNSLIEYRMLPHRHRTQTIRAASATTEWSYTTNRDGFRGKDIHPQKNPSTKRILFLGDSYTFGIAVNDHEILSEQIASLFNQKNNFIVESVNVGVPGYNTVQEYELLKDEAEIYHPDMIILGYVMNDAEPQLTVPSNPRITYKYARFWLIEFLKFRLNVAFFPKQPFFNVALQQRNKNYLEGFSPTSVKWKNSKKALEAIAHFCNQRNIPLLVIIFPDFSEAFDSSYCCQMIHDRVKEWCDESQIQVIDLLSYFQDRDHREFWVEGEGHPNGRAYRKIAEILIDPIQKKLAQRR